ncbi:hypothetical protein B0H10DRAFT_2128793 [Mycena sp. CBHHK59/15]|nr:hypothetical protein B0H10DRAFT_2128793 [Mycena sp. CBHHK59/15]
MNALDIIRKISPKVVQGTRLHAAGRHHRPLHTPRRGADVHDREPLALHDLTRAAVLQRPRVQRIQGAARDATVKGSCASERRDGAAHYKPSFKYTPGQWLFLRIPGILRFQWHPFITSAPKDLYVSVHIRRVGDFTHALGERLGVGHAVVAEMTAAAMQGADVEKSSGFRGDYVELAASTALPGVAILVGAGIDSISAGSCNRLTKPMYRRHALCVDPKGHMVPAEGRLKSLQRVEFFWICRDAPSFGWFQNLLAERHLTQTMSDDMIWNIALNDAGSDYDPLMLLRTLFGDRKRGIYCWKRLVAADQSRGRLIFVGRAHREGYQRRHFFFCKGRGLQFPLLISHP